jgi:predicted SAM-dependent methyltransferase
MLNTEGLGLEIGPSYNPLMPKSEGFRVEVLDHANQETLFEKYRKHPDVDWQKIEKVDYVSDGRRMSEIIGDVKRYDYIVASHVIEHVPDMIGFLQDCETLLKEDGVLVLAVPDKRYCFDVLRPVSTIGNIIQAYIEKRTRHTPGTIFDHIFMSAAREGHSVWSEADSGPIGVMYPATFATDSLKWSTSGTGYNDAHAWQYTPSSFRLAIQMMNYLGYLSLKELRFELPPSFEFYISLSSSGPGCNIVYNELLTNTLRELKAVNT